MGDKLILLLTVTEKFILETLLGRVSEIESDVRKGKYVRRVSLENGALKTLLADVAGKEGFDNSDAYDYLLELIDKLIRASVIIRVGERHDRERIGILEVKAEPSSLSAQIVAEPREDIVKLEEKEVTVAGLRARAEELREQMESNSKEFQALKVETAKRLEAGQVLSLEKLARYNKLCAKQVTESEREELQRRLDAYDLVIADLEKHPVLPADGASPTSSEERKPRVRLPKPRKSNKDGMAISPEGRIAIAYAGNVTDPKNWVTANEIKDIVMEEGTDMSEAVIRPLISSSSKKARATVGYFESRPVTEEEKMRLGWRTRLLYRLSEEGVKFAQTHLYEITKPKS